MRLQVVTLSFLIWIRSPLFIFTSTYVLHWCSEVLLPLNKRLHLCRYEFDVLFIFWAYMLQHLIRHLTRFKCINPEKILKIKPSTENMFFTSSKLFCLNVIYIHWTKLQNMKMFFNFNLIVSWRLSYISKSSQDINHQHKINNFW